MKIIRNQNPEVEFPYIVTMDSGTPVKHFYHRNEAESYLDHVRKYSEIK